MKHGYRWLIGALVAVGVAVALALIAPGGQGSLAADSTIYYVDADATGANNGSTWPDGFTTLQPALDAVLPEDQIWVAEGTYKPTAEHGGTGARYSSFQLKNGVALYGGFDPSVGDTAWQDRDWEANPTILSGDIGTEGNASDNSYHVFYHPAATGLNSSAILDGFTITGGNTVGPSAPYYGGGMYNSASSPALTRCTFSGNSAGEGGGMHNTNSSAPTLTTCTFEGNSADQGGGMSNYYSSPALTDCTFSGNSADFGGGIYNNYYSEPVLTGCTFEGNSTRYHGAGMHNRNHSDPTLADCTFEGNSADGDGGGMYNDGSSPALTNCTFEGNSASAFAGGAMHNKSSSPTLTNCILWGDTPQEMYNYDLDSSPHVSYSDVQGGCDTIWGNVCGTGNIDADPWFVDPDNSDLHLGTCSRCIDRGDNLAPDLPDLDFEGDDRIVDGDDDGAATVDMGVDEVVGGMPCFHLYLPAVLKRY